MLSLKSSVDSRGIKPELVLGLFIAHGVYQKYGVDLIVTSLTDGQHMPTSLHKKGLAADLRLPITQLANGYTIQDLVTSLKTNLGSQWDVVLEGANTPGSTGGHIHFEFDPKSNPIT